jgi:hypothetical protein
LPDHDLVSVRDSGADHRIVRHLEQEKAAFTDQLPGQRIDVNDSLVSEDRTAPGIPSD